MRLEIDQSGKIENTSKPTVLAFSNSHSDIIVLKTQDKKAIQTFFRQINKPRLFVHITFVAAIFLLIKDHLAKNDQIIIDREYLGYEKFIHRKLHEFINDNSRVGGITIHSHQIGKKSQAHLLAYSVSRKKTYNKVKKINKDEIIRIIKANLKSGST